MRSSGEVMSAVESARRRMRQGESTAVELTQGHIRGYESVTIELAGSEQPRAEPSSQMESSQRRGPSSLTASSFGTMVQLTLSEIPRELS